LLQETTELALYMNRTTIVTSIEVGPLETQVLMLAESLRAFGGHAAGTEMIAVKPRHGPSISSHTRRELTRLHVHFIDERLNVRLAWWNNANKSAIMAALETRVSTPNITWIDGDMIILRPPDDLDPDVNTDFIARAGEGYLGSNGADENAPYWRKLTTVMGLDFDQFPMIRSFPEQRPIHAYWQAGLYSYDARTRLGYFHHHTISKLLASNIGSKHAGVYHQDQVSIALAVQMLGLRHSQFYLPMNFNLNWRAKQNANIVPIDQVKIIHYHDSLWPERFDWAMTYLEKLPPDRIELIRKYVPLSVNAAFLSRLARKILSLSRRRKARRFERRAILY
jgi:hypothetical protein